MKILIINFEKENTIASSNAFLLALMLKKRGNNVTLFGIENSYLENEALKNKITFIKLGFKEKLGIINLKDFDVFDIFSFSYEYILFIKKIFSYNKPVFLRIFNFFKPEIFKNILKIEKQFYKIMPSCQSLLDEMLKIGFNENKLFLFYPSINMTRWESAKLIKTAMFLKRPYKVGISYRKIRFDELFFFLQIAKKVIYEMENVNFVMVGPKSEKIREMARDMQISHKIDMLDFRTDMPEVMAMLHIFIKTDKEKNISRSLIEAMASGVVCIVPRINGLSDFVINDNTGIILNDKSIDSYSNIIKNLINNPSRCQTFSTLSFNYVNNNMSQDNLVNLSLVLYEESLL